jgi:hypothetical protein
MLQEPHKGDTWQQQVKKEDTAREDILMKQYCKNDCGRSVREPRSKSWKIDGICPACRDKLAYSHPRITQTFDGEITVRKRNPVDFYWDQLAKRDIQIDENR